jgi:hypothetical protein
MIAFIMVLYDGVICVIIKSWKLTPISQVPKDVGYLHLQLKY